MFKAIRSTVALMAKLHRSLPAMLEKDLKKIQGKGFGSKSVFIEAKVCLEFLEKLGVRDPVVLDVGANIGNYSDAILKIKPGSRVFAFEPSTAAREVLKARFEGNSRVQISALALGIENSRQSLWSDAAGSGLASLTRRRLDHFGINVNFSESVEVSTLDDWLETNLVRPDLVKLDVEGHELDVLKGSLKSLSLIKVIQFEFGGCNIDTRTFFQDFWYLLGSEGFTLFRVSNHGPIRIHAYSEDDECFTATNYVAVRL